MPAAPPPPTGPAAEAPVALVSPPCALCGGERHRVLIPDARDWIWRKPGSFSVQRCLDCGLVATRPRPADEDLGFYYAGTYSGSGSAVDARGFYASPVGRLLLRYRLATLAKVRPLGADDRLLDVGCGHGSFVAHAAARTGCSAAGIDLDAGSVAGAEARDRVDYRVGRLPEADYPEGAFTVVTFIEALEHEADPVGALRAAWRVLEPGGLCLVEVPDFGGAWRRVFGAAWLPLMVPQHLHHFERDTLRRAFEAAGFEVVHRQSMFFPLEFVASLAIALARVLGPERGEAAGPLRRLYEKAARLLLFVLWWVAEIPTQAALRLLGRTGHMTMIGRKPADQGPPGTSRAAPA